MTLIISSVGANAPNNPYDVKVVQGLLKEARYPISVDGKIGKTTIETIKVFQKDKLQIKDPDGTIDANGKTIQTLGQYAIRQYYKLKDSDITIGQRVIPKLKELAIQFYYCSQGKVPVVTSGTRTASEQADAMYVKLHDEKEDITRLYKDKTHVNQVIVKYNELNGKNKSRAEIVAAMAQVITSQINQGTYISRHLVANAVDIRSIDLSIVQKKDLIKIAQRYKVKILDEGKPPHLHLEF